MMFRLVCCPLLTSPPDVSHRWAQLHKALWPHKGRTTSDPFTKHTVNYGEESTYLLDLTLLELPDRPQFMIIRAQYDLAWRLFGETEFSDEFIKAIVVTGHPGIGQFLLIFFGFFPPHLPLLDQGKRFSCSYSTSASGMDVLLLCSSATTPSCSSTRMAFTRDLAMTSMIWRKRRGR